MASGRTNRSASKAVNQYKLHTSNAADTQSGSRMPEQSTDYRVAVFGAGGVGKSSIICRFIKGEFNDSYTPTIEDTYRTVIGCSSDKQKNVCTMQITDSAGSHQFPAMMRLAMSKGHAFLLVYSVTSKQSLEELGPIVTMMKEVKGARIAQTPIVLVGNKCDESNRQVSTELGKKISGGWGTGFIETSAKTNTNIGECFQLLLERDNTRTLTLNMDNSGKHKKKCALM